jgi:hypothetical protein
MALTDLVRKTISWTEIWTKHVFLLGQCIIINMA